MKEAAGGCRVIYGFDNPQVEFIQYIFFFLVKQKCCVLGSRIPDLTVYFPS